MTRCIFIARAAAAALVFVAPFAARPALAEPAAQANEAYQQNTQAGPEQSNNEEWYGLPIILSDTTAVLLLSGLALGRPTDVVMGGGSALFYTLGGPIVHWLEGQNRNALYSLGLRLLPVTVGSAIIYANRDDRSMQFIGIGAAILAFGSLAAMVLDPVALAWKPTESGPRVAFVPGQTQAGTTTLNLVGVW